MGLHELHEYNAARKESLQTLSVSSSSGPLVKALANYALRPVGDNRPALANALNACWREPSATPQDLYRAPIRAAMAQLWGNEVADRTGRILALQRECIFSSSPLRRSYHSSTAEDWPDVFFQVLTSCAIWPLYALTPAEAAALDTTRMTGYTLHMALALRENDPAAVHAAREAMLGDNSTYLITTKLICAVVTSGNRELIELLGKLLLAAKGQEGLRQQILENMDWGTVETTLSFLRLIADHDLTRFSSVIRALDTWTGLGYGSVKPALAEKCVRLAIEMLSDPAAARRGLESGDVLEIYFALWATAGKELGNALPMVERLLESGVAYKKLAALYFTLHTDSARFSLRVVVNHLDEEDEECLAWLLSILGQSFCWQRAVSENAMGPLGELSPARRNELFDRLEALVDRVGGRKRSFSGGAFPWATVTLDPMPAYALLLGLAARANDRDLIDRLAERRESLDPEQRTYLYGTLLIPTLPDHRALLRDALGDRSSYARNAARGRLVKQGLDWEDVSKLCETLSTRDSSQRKEIAELLSDLSDSLLDPALGRLLDDGDELRLQAGLSLLLSQRKARPALVKKHLAHLPSPDGLSGQTLVLLEQLTDGGERAEYTSENGFGLYDPKAPCFTPLRPEPPDAPKAGLLQKLLGGGAVSAAALKKLTDISEDEVFSLFRRIRQVFLDHADYEYETRRWDGSREKVLFGNTDWRLPLPAEYADEQGPHPLEHYPFHEEFLAAAGRFATDGVALANLSARLNRSYGSESPSALWLLKKLSPLELTGDLNQRLFRELGSQNSAVHGILALLAERARTPAVFEHCFTVYTGLMDLVGEADWCKNTATDPLETYYHQEAPAYEFSYLSYWRYQARHAVTDDRDFVALFRRLRYESLTVGKNLCLELEDYLRAYRLKLVSQEVLLEQLTAGPDAAKFLSTLTDNSRQAKELLEQYPELTQWTGAAVHRIVSMEAKRGELPTPLSRCVSGIARYEGAGYFAALLTALGKDNFYRGYEWSYQWAQGGNISKTEALSRLLRHCFPAPEDTAETLSAALERSKLKPQRLAEAALYAPQWAPLLEEVTGWKGLKRGVWFFHAHVSERFSAEKETEVALYSPVTPQQFNDGAFDKDWFLSAYETLGEERFRTLYKSAKYITTGSIQHRRSQLYADAVLGRLDEGELRREIEEKRNQEKLRCYPLIPLTSEGDALARYEFIRRFEHESRQFGALRRDSEKKACRTALENLAITMGCPDVDRMLWRLEGKKLESVRVLMSPQDLGAATVFLSIGDDGEPSLAIEKEGKAQKSLPAALKKHAAVLELQRTVKELREQRRRGKQSLENAMVTASSFLRGELEGLLENPLLSPIASALLWTDGVGIGLPSMEDGTLVLRDAQGEALPAGADTLRLAHPHDLALAGVWSAWQSRVFADKLLQPFKQVFREYYPLTDEERFEGSLSRRYAGNQVQPKKAVALLRGRGWTVDYEEGLQKVCYEADLVARIFAMADWFSPAEIEPPTLEILRFYRRSDGAVLDLADVPPITLSEVMRDLDLMVSVAHAGGVDPEASHSTVEMRVAIAGELLSLLGVENVSFIGSHAKIRGSLGSYSVHMGSGVTHTEGVGSLVILPVHSQTRGRIFLPFADDDPKTAEIMSKILLLAEDRKIKDPGILSQIK